MDIDIFLDARKVVEALRNRDCSEALAWCAENKSKLKKSKVSCTSYWLTSAITMFLHTSKYIVRGVDPLYHYFLSLWGVLEEV